MALTKTRRQKSNPIFGANLKAIRKQLYPNQSELAEKLGVKQPSISAWERGSVPDLERLVALARELGGFSVLVKGIDADYDAAAIERRKESRQNVNFSLAEGRHEIDSLEHQRSEPHTTAGTAFAEPQPFETSGRSGDPVTTPGGDHARPASTTAEISELRDLISGRFDEISGSFDELRQAITQQGITLASLVTRTRIPVAPIESPRQQAPAADPAEPKRRGAPGSRDRRSPRRTGVAPIRVKEKKKKAG